MKSGKSLRYKSSAIKDFYNAIKNIYYLNQFGKQACLTSDFLYIICESSFINKCYSSLNFRKIFNTEVVHIYINLRNK